MAEAFSFNFFGEQAGKEQQPCAPGGTGDGPEGAGDGGGRAAGQGAAAAAATAEEVPPSAGDRPAAEALSAVHLDGGVALLKGAVSSARAAELLSNPELAESDLVPQAYEGGFKLWEGAIDLCNVLISRERLTREALTAAASSPAAAPDGGGGGGGLHGRKVLELGCGHGLPGILALLAGAAEVVFQDYNREVLTALTMPNVAANLAALLPRGAPRARPRFFAGAWGDVGELLGSPAHGMGGHFDVILTAETVYERASQEQLLDALKTLLRPPHGRAYVAAKRHYFGVGGGAASFAALVRRDGVLQVERVWQSLPDNGGGGGRDNGDGNEDSSGGSAAAAAAAAAAGGDNVREVLLLRFNEAIQPYFM